MTRLLPTIASLTVLLAACDDAAVPLDPPDPPPVAAVEVTAPAAALEVGATLQLTATTFDPYGRELTGRTITWATSDAAVATVSGSGLVTAQAPGAVTISAHAETKTGSATLTVRELAPVVAWIEVDPGGEVALAPGGTLQVSATAYAADGAIVDCAMSWESGDDTVATVSASGLVTAAAEGSTSIAAVCQDQRDELAVRVAAPPSPVARVTLDQGEVLLVPEESLQLHAQPRDVANEPVVHPVTWSSDRPDIATVDATGMVSALSAGTALITATSGAHSAEARVSVASGASRLLDSVNGAPLPTTLASYTQVDDDGVTRTHTYVLEAGYLGVVSGEARYQLLVRGRRSRTGSVPVWISLASAGTVRWDADAGYTRYLPDDPAERPFHGNLLADGSLRIVWQPIDNSAPATVAFVVE